MVVLDRLCSEQLGDRTSTPLSATREMRAAIDLGRNATPQCGAIMSARALDRPGHPA